MSLVGIVVLLGIAVLLSDNRKAINLRTVGGAFAIQFFLGAFVLYVPVGRDVLYGASEAVANVINYGNQGIEFLFGGLVSGIWWRRFRIRTTCTSCNRILCFFNCCSLLPRHHANRD
ncbi:hypothetical protein GCM10007987_30840 [Aliivibrio fischeri]|nr:hypothetical protein GCM10007987_30840 [Aliivibrio fischeri]